MHKAKLVLYSYVISLLIIVIHGVSSHIYSKHCATVSFLGYFDMLSKVGSPFCQTILFVVNKSNELYNLMMASLIIALSASVSLIHNYLLSKVGKPEFNNDSVFTNLNFQNKNIN